MAALRKTAGMLNFERQLDKYFPNRKKPDGWIADEFHTGVSDHHPDDTPGSKPGWNGDPDSIPDVRGIDVWFDLGDGVDCVDLLNHLRRVPKIGTVFRYFILRGKIYHVRTGFKPEDYDGDFHGDHLHGSLAWTEAADDNTTFDFRLEEIPVALTAADKAWIVNAIRAEVAKTGHVVWEHPLEDPLSTATPKGKVMAGTIQRYRDQVAIFQTDRIIDAIEKDAQDR